jgi:cytochrome b6-f complex iron-sulfur subunit
MHKHFTRLVVSVSSGKTQTRMENQLIKTGTLSEQRRDFLKKTGALATMTMFGVGFFTACSSDDVTPAAATSTDGVTVNPDTVLIDLTEATTLNTTGGWLLITEARMLVVNTGSGFSSLTSVCTHTGCDRNWSFSNNQFTCNCHGSRFTTSGLVVNGPASSALRSFTNSRSGDVLTINRG